MSNARAIKWLTAGHFTTDVYSGLLNPLMPFVCAKLSIPLAVATVIIGTAHIFSSLLQPIFGFLADSTLKRSFIFWGLILSSIFIPLVAVSPTLGFLTLFMILGSLGNSFYHPQALGFIIKFSDSSASKSMGIFMSMGSFGYSLGPIIAAVIIQNYGTEKLIYTMIIGLLLAASMFFCVPKMSDTAEAPHIGKFFTVLKTIMKNRIFDYLLIISMMKVIISSSSMVLLPFLWKDDVRIQHTALYIGVGLFLFIVATSLGTLISRKLECKFGTKRLLYFSMIMTFPLMFGFSYFYHINHLIALALYVTTGFISSFAQPITMVMAQKLFPEYKSIIAGFINGVCWGVIAILLSFLGTVCEKIGITTVLAIISFAPLISSVFVKYLNEDYDKV